MAAKRLKPAELWSRRDIARELGRSVRLVEAWGLRDDFPPAVGRRGNAKVYRADQVRRWWTEHGIDQSPERWSMRRAAAELGVDREMLRSARGRGQLPTPDGHVGVHPWWRPDTLRAWHAARTVPAGVWLRRDVAAFLGRTVAPPLRDLPPADGTSARGAWWRPDTIQAWHVEREQRRADAAAVREARRPPKLGSGQLYGKDVAEATGLSWDTVRTYRRKGLLPEPDGWHRHRPWWSREAVACWDASRRKRGPARVPSGKSDQRVWA